MTKDIIKDKFSRPFLFAILLGVFYFYNINDWFFILITFTLVLTIFVVVNILRKDLYIQSYVVENELFNILYQKNFSVKQVETFSILSASIESVAFNSKTLFEPFHKISIKYIDQKGFYDKKTFKTNSDDTFINILHVVKRNEN